MTIRPAQPGDFDGVTLLLAQLWPDKELDRDALTALFGRGLASDRREFLCVEAGGGIVGFCAIEYHDSLWHEGEVAYVEVLVVDGTWRGQGIGALMMAEAERFAQDRGCKSMELDSAFHRERAHAFYEKLGFAKRGWVFSKDL